MSANGPGKTWSAPPLAHHGSSATGDTTPSVTYDPAALRKEFVGLLDDLVTGLQTSEIRRVAGEGLLKQLRGQQSAALSRLQGEFSLVVIGDFKRGKSTLINALLGLRVVTTNVTPETVSINEIGYGVPLQAVVCLADGGRITLDLADLQADRLAPLLDRIARQSPQAAHVHIQAPVEWLQGLRIVDTPGLSDLWKRFDAQVSEYLPQADAIIYVISALSPLSETERTYLQMSVLPRDFPKVLFVANAIDRHNEADARRVLDRIAAGISQMFPQARVFGISALDETCRQQGLARPNPTRAAALEAAFQEFRGALQESILLNRDVIQLDRTIAQATQALRDFEKNLGRLSHVMQAEVQQLDRAIASCEDGNSELHGRLAQQQRQLGELIDGLREQAGGWMEEFGDRLQEEVVPHIGDYDLSDIQRHFHFFLSDAVRKAMDLCLDAHRPVILENLQQVGQAISDEIDGLALAPEAEREIVEAIGQTSAVGQTWTNFDTIRLVLDAGLGGVLNLAAGLALRQWKEQDKARAAVRYQEQVAHGLPELRQSIKTEIHSIYDKLKVEVQEQVEAALRQEINASLAALRQARDLATQGQRNGTTDAQGVAHAQTLVSGTRAALEPIRHKLWSASTGS